MIVCPSHNLKGGLPLMVDLDRVSLKDLVKRAGNKLNIKVNIAQ